MLDLPKLSLTIKQGPLKLASILTELTYENDSDVLFLEQMVTLVTKHSLSVDTFLFLANVFIY